MNRVTDSREDVAAKLEIKMKKLADKYGYFTKEEISQAYNEMERMDIGVFVTPFGKMEEK